MKPSKRLQQTYTSELNTSARSEFGLASIPRTDEEQRIVDALVASKLPPLLYGSDIAVWLGVTKGVFDALVSSKYGHYKQFEISKDKGQKRTLRVPVPILHHSQKSIKLQILDTREVSEAAHAYRKGRGAATAARPHEGKSHLWTFDLKDFFSCITFDKVIGVYESMGYPTNAASALAELTALEDGGLPQGTCTSPALSNLALYDLDEQLLKLADKHKVTYTRYADDFSFSRMSRFSKTFQEAVQKRVAAAGFKLHPRKSRLRGPLCSRQVANLVINNKTSIPRERRRNIRAIFHKVALSPESFSQERARLLGLANWVSRYHPEEGAKYLALVKKIKHSK